jgi:hypothetical protein
VVRDRRDVGCIHFRTLSEEWLRSKMVLLGQSHANRAPGPKRRFDDAGSLIAQSLEALQRA